MCKGKSQSLKEKIFLTCVQQNTGQFVQSLGRNLQGWNYNSGTRNETTFFNGRLILETGTKWERKCRFHYLCPQGNPQGTWYS